jgi:hypothetical protein
MAMFDRASRRLMRLVRATEVDVGMLVLPWHPYACVVITLDGACLLRLQTIPAR